MKKLSSELEKSNELKAFKKQIIELTEKRIRQLIMNIQKTRP